MSTRLHRAKRVLAAQHSLHERAQLEHARIDRKIADLTSMQTDIVEALNSDDHLHGLFISAADRRMRSLSRQMTVLKDEGATASKVLLKAGMQLKCAEKLFDAATRVDTRDREKKEFLDLVDGLVRKPNTRFP